VTVTYLHYVTVLGICSDLSDQHCRQQQLTRGFLQCAPLGASVAGDDDPKPVSNRHALTIVKQTVNATAARRFSANVKRDIRGQNRERCESLNWKISH
jgi:hypothetical protein